MSVSSTGEFSLSYLLCSGRRADATRSAISLYWRVWPFSYTFHVYGGGRSAPWNLLHVSTKVQLKAFLFTPLHLCSPSPISYQGLNPLPVNSCPLSTCYPSTPTLLLSYSSMLVAAMMLINILCPTKHYRTTWHFNLCIGERISLWTSGHEVHRSLIQ